LNLVNVFGRKKSPAATAGPQGNLRHAGQGGTAWVRYDLAATRDMVVPCNSSDTVTFIVLPSSARCAVIVQVINKAPAERR
jgi:hypothetical protein